MLDSLFIFGAVWLVWVPPVALGIYFLSSSRAEKMRLAALAAIALPAAFALSRIASLFYYSERPFADGEIMPLVTHAADNGFPSDHALLAFAVAFVALERNRTLGSALVLIAILVSVSRIWAGVHNPIDIAGSILVAALGTLMAISARRYILKPVY